MCIKVALCDDELTFRCYLRDIFTQVAKDSLLDFEDFESGEELLDRIRYGIHYDIIFLDVQLKKMSGNDVGKMIRKQDDSTMLVFCSGVQLTVPPEVIRESIPFSYILKTIEEKELKEELNAVLKAYQQQQNVHEKFVVLDCCDFGNKKININDILYFTNESRLVRRKVRVQCTNGTNLYVEGSLKMLFEKVRALGFDFAHNSFLVNCRHVDRISKKTCTVVLDNEEEIQLARSKTDSFTEQFTAVMEERRT